MARYVATVHSPRPPSEVFSFLADLTNFVEWDPGVVATSPVTETEGERAPLAVGTEVDVTVKAVPRPLVLRYRLTTYEPPRTVVAEARSARLTSIDTITVDPEGAGDGSVVTYDASLTLNGVFAKLDPLFGPIFGRIGARAADGLAATLDGELRSGSTA